MSIYNHYKISWVFLCTLIIACGSVKAQDIVTETFKILADNGAANDWLGDPAVSGNLAVLGATGVNQRTGAAYVYDLATNEFQFELIPSEIEIGDGFGTRPSISGNIVIIGAPLDDGRMGSAYVFDLTTGEQIWKFVANDRSSIAEFGINTAIDGNIALIGAWVDQGVGAVYVFDITTGDQLWKLVANDQAPDNGFGHSVGILGNLAVVGSVYNDDGATRTGAVYWFDITNGTQIRKTNLPEPIYNARLGASVAINSQYVLSGAPGSNGAIGAAHVFALDGTPLHVLYASDGASNDWFGREVAISQGKAIVTAMNDDNRTGSAYVFDLVTGQEVAKLVTSDGEVGDDLGWFASIDGNTILVGATGDDDNGTNAGAVYVFDLFIDTDGDGLSDSDEIDIYGTDPLDPDTDDDGLLDGTEVELAIANETGCPNPLDPDSDGDTLLDGAEVAAGTDPCSADTDGDNLPDNVDPTPLVPGAPPEYLAQLALDLADAICILDPTLFRENDEDHEDDEGRDRNRDHEDSEDDEDSEDHEDHEGDEGRDHEGYEDRDRDHDDRCWGRRNGLANFARKAAKEINRGRYDHALDKLAKLWARIDGQSPPPDWMVDSPERDILQSEIEELIMILLFL